MNIFDCIRQAESLFEEAYQHFAKGKTQQEIQNSVNAYDWADIVSNCRQGIIADKISLPDDVDEAEFWEYVDTNFLTYMENRIKTQVDDVSFFQLMMVFIELAEKYPVLADLKADSSDVFAEYALEALRKCVDDDYDYEKSWLDFVQEWLPSYVEQLADKIAKQVAENQTQQYTPPNEEDLPF